MNRNYKEDQNTEVETLDSIYCGDMEILATEPFHKMKIHIATQGYDKEQCDSGLACYLVFTYTPTYPDEAPIVEIEDTVNFKENYECKLLEHMQKTIDQNIGTEMIFSLVSSGQEWLYDTWDILSTAKEEEAERKLLEIEEAERKKFEGTRVTVESFMKWKMNFEESTGIAAKREKSTESIKLTGRELFIRDNTLNDSDIKFLLEAGDSIESVKIDEALFQEIGELDLYDDDEDDEDWVPGSDD